MSYPNYPGQYPGQPQPGYPPNQPQYPGYPPAPGLPGSFSPYSNTQPGYPPATGFNPQPGYPPAPGFSTNPSPGYPSANPGYPPSTPGYPPANPGYPGSSNPGYPPSNPGYPSPNPGYPQAVPEYPSSVPGYPSSAPGYPSSVPTYPPAGQQQQGFAPPGGAYLPPAGQAAHTGYPVSPYPSLPTSDQHYQQHQQHQHVPQSQSQHLQQHPQQRMQPPVEPNIPTVLPASPFDPRADADALHKAMKGFGTDEKGLIAVLCHRTAAQRVEIVKAYKSGYGKDLQSKIKSEVSGNFERLLVALSQPIDDYMASEMHNAVCGIGTVEGTLIEILCSGNNKDIRGIAVAYQRLYGHSMEKDIKGDTSGTLKMLLVSLAQGNRDENTYVDIGKAKEDAQRLYQAGEAKMGTDESAFNSVLATRSWPQIRQIITEYKNMHNSSLEKAVISEFSANAEKGLLAILRCAQSQACYFAERLHKAISGLGTRDRCLVRLIVSHCDSDLGNIKREYEKLYGRSLAADISNDTSGDYKKGLLALVS